MHGVRVAIQSATTVAAARESSSAHTPDCLVAVAEPTVIAELATALPDHALVAVGVGPGARTSRRDCRGRCTSSWCSMASSPRCLIAAMRRAEIRVRAASTAGTRALAEHERVEALVHDAGHAAMFFDADAWIVWVSPNSARVLRREPYELVGRNGFDLVHPDDRAAPRADSPQLEQPGDRVDVEFRALDLDGSVHWLEEQPRTAARGFPPPASCSRLMRTSRSGGPAPSRSSSRRTCWQRSARPSLRPTPTVASPT